MNIRVAYFFNVGIKIRTVDRWKLVSIEKKSVKKIFIIGKKPDGNEDKTKEKYLLRKLWTPMIIKCCLLLTKHGKWLVKNSWKTF